MPTLDEIPEEENSPTHLLLIADTKMGKTTYAIQAAIDGYYVLYIDSDNGKSALDWLLRDKPEVKKRIMYFRTNKPCKFQDKLLHERVFRWNLTRDDEFSSGLAAPDDKMVEIIPTRIPKGLIVVNDSWTSTALDAMELGAAANKTTLEQMKQGNDSQGVYGAAGLKLTLLCAIYQQCKFNLIVLAHPTVFEIYQKPVSPAGSGTKLVEIKQKDMILVDVVKVPLSSSRPHGYSMGKYFTDIGWIELDRMGNRMLDFQIEYKRIGGGRPNRIGNITDMSFRKLFGEPTEVSFDSSWIRHYTTTQWKEANQSLAAAPAQSNVLPVNPVASPMASLMAKK